MEAGEAVYRGREGTGLAQILNWQQAKTPQYNPLAQQRAEQQKRQAREQELKKLDKDLDLGLGSTFFNPHLVQKAESIKQKGHNVFGQTNSYNESSRAISDDITNFKKEAQLSLSATEELKRNREDIYSGKDKFIRPSIANKYNYNFYHPESRDVNDVNWEAGRNMFSLPGIDDPEGRIVAHAKALKEGISSEDVDVRNKIMGNNGQYVQKTGDSYHFKSNPDGTVHNDVIKGYLMQDNGRGSKNADGILWQTIAEENGLDQENDLNKIDEIYLNTKNKIKEAPESEFSQKVQKKIMDKVRSIVEPLNYHKHKESLVSIGRNPSARSAGLNDHSPETNVQDSTEIEFTPTLDQANQNKGVIGRRMISTALGHLKSMGKVTLSDGNQYSDLYLGRDIDSGNPLIYAVKKIGSHSQLVTLPLNDKNIAFLKSEAEKKGELKTFNKDLESHLKAIENAPDIEKDSSKLDEVSKQIASNLKSFDKSKTPDFLTSIQSVFEQAGISQPSVEVQKSWLGNPKAIKIESNGKEKVFDIGDNDLKSIQDFIYESNPGAFGKVKGKTQPTSTLPKNNEKGEFDNF